MVVELRSMKRSENSLNESIMGMAGMRHSKPTYNPDLNKSVRMRSI